MAKRSRSRSAIAVVVATVAVAAIVAAVVWAFLLVPAKRVAAGRPVQVRVAQGAGTQEIATQLARVGVVPNALAFRLFVMVRGAEGKLHAGVYDLRSGMSYSDALARLESGGSAPYESVVIPEGFDIEQIAARMHTDAGVSEKEFLKLARTGAPVFAARHPYLAHAYSGSLEGFLFPATYQVRRGSSAKQVIGMMLDQFDSRIAGVDTSRAKAAGLSLPQVVTIASMIEKEAKLPRDRPLVSSVIYNRLKRGMRLEIDATIQYVLLRQHFRLSYRQTQVKTPYNTYLHKGLPPGPISNPGLASLEAAANPAKTNYLYYVLIGKDGSLRFTTNRADFLKAKAQSKEVFGR